MWRSSSNGSAKRAASFLMRTLLLMNPSNQGHANMAGHHDRETKGDAMRRMIFGWIVAAALAASARCEELLWNGILSGQQQLTHEVAQESLDDKPRDSKRGWSS